MKTSFLTIAACLLAGLPILVHDGGSRGAIADRDLAHPLVELHDDGDDTGGVEPAPAGSVDSLQRDAAMMAQRILQLAAAGPAASPEALRLERDLEALQRQVAAQARLVKGAPTD